MFWAYILKSVEQNRFYAGYTDNLERRLAKHNAGKNTYSKRYAPWKIVHCEIFEDKRSAINRERYFKSAAGRKWLKKYINQ